MAYRESLRISPDPRVPPIGWGLFGPFPGPFRPLAELHNRLIHGREPRRAELGRGACWATVDVDHLARAMTGPVGDPSLGAPHGQRQGNEGSTQVVNADRLSLFRAVEQLRTRDASRA